MPLPRFGGFYVRAERIRYASYASRWIGAGGESLELEIRLGTDAVPLEPLIVVTRTRRSDRLAGFRQRLGRGPTGNFVIREDIERRSAAPVTELIRPLAGVDVIEVPRRPGSPVLSRLIVMRGIRSDEVPAAGGANWCFSAIFPDGIRVEQSPEFPIDDQITTASLVGIEVYSSAASVPVEFHRGGSNTCGTVILWIRAADPNRGRSGW